MVPSSEIFSLRRRDERGRWNAAETRYFNWAGPMADYLRFSPGSSAPQFIACVLVVSA
jgi:hypothetical protein